MHCWRCWQRRVIRTGLSVEEERSHFERSCGAIGGTALCQKDVLVRLSEVHVAAEVLTWTATSGCVGATERRDRKVGRSHGQVVRARQFAVTGDNGQYRTVAYMPQLPSDRDYFRME